MRYNPVIMEFNCCNKSCNAPLFKSYGTTYKLRGRHVRWDSLEETAVMQCNVCRAFTEVPISLKLGNAGVVLEVGTEIKKGIKKEIKLVVKDKK